MSLQLFGSVELPDGKALAMLCSDADRPQECMVHLWGYGEDSKERLAVLLKIETESQASIHLSAINLFRTYENGALYLPPLSPNEIQDMRSVKVQLNRTNTEFSGSWSGLDSKSGAINLRSTPEEENITAEKCDDWSSFKVWATRARRERNLVLFRGHGSNQFRLQTTLARIGRHRLQRYCMETLAEFHSQAEAILGMRLNMNDGNDYSVVLGLAQHHGLPTPLLDWTESPYIAAFFAFSDALESEAYRLGHTHVRIFGLPRSFIESTSPANVVLHQVYPYVATLGVSPRHNPRLLAQQGKFLVTNISNLEHWLLDHQIRIGSQVLHAVDVPIICAREALEDLAFMGLTAASLFPGLDGVCKKMKHQMSTTKPAGISSPLPSRGGPEVVSPIGINQGSAS